MLLPVFASALLSACGGGAESQSGRPQVQASLASGTTTLQLTDPALPGAAQQQLAQPAFHVAAALLNVPDDTDADGRAASARMQPRMQAVPATFSSLSTRGLTVRQLESARDQGTQNAAIDGAAAPMAQNNVVSTYSPAQIRAAYGLSLLPAPGAALTAAQAAQLGAGQTIYIVDAKHDPNVIAELAAFNQKFGLPTCTVKTIPAGASLPLATASGSGCEVSVVFNSAGGTMTGVQPAYDSGWATEIALDVQWAHATAPLARIVLIEAPDATLNNLLGAVKLANAMGPGIVSMSFAAPEGNWTASVDPVFAAANMSYLAATGDSGAAVQWPAVSANVVAVGGTTLTYSGTGARSEVSWSGTGGGVSAYMPAPSYQTNAVPGMGFATHRNVADVAFNADPNTGQYLAVIPSGSSSVQWLSAGGTSLATPQWAGLIAVANAVRALNAKSALGAPHAVLYGQISAVPGTYASVFYDVTKGSDGSCAICTARIGYDQLTGLGTPNGSSLLSSLSGAALAATPPVVTSASISGQVGTALSFTVSVTAPDPVTYTLSGAPAGMTIGSTGAVNWATPVAGSYAVTVSAKDSKTGLSGQGIYTVVIAPPATAPVVTAASIGGKAGTALSFTVSVRASNPVTYSLSGAPAGMSISSAGVVTWPVPVAGTYAVIVTAKDTKTGQSGQGVYTVTIGAAAVAGPVITAPAMNGVAGRPLSGSISISDPGATSLSISISGIPMGMTFSSNGLNLTAQWANPVAGSYSLKVSVTDAAGRSAQLSVPVTIAAK
ncbi:MAG TPA: S53 family peptidase [Undibacterium sp.]|nr:S53 family peptidase [Undibacterium sp.]HTD03991.1 S53 family peptidase [Undibacterium sp.]